MYTLFELHSPLFDCLYKLHVLTEVTILSLFIFINRETRIFQQLYASIKENFKDVAPAEEPVDEDDDNNNDAIDDHGYMGTDLANCLGIINASLVPAFNLEVCTVSLPPPYKTKDDEGNTQTQDEGNRKRAALTKYHAIVNRSNDDVAKSHAFPLAKG